MGVSRRALAEDRRPAQAGLGSLQDEEFEEHSIVMDWHAPLVVVTGDVQRIGFDPLAQVGFSQAWQRGIESHMLDRLALDRWNGV